MAKNSNIVRFRKSFHFNIGFVIFFIIFVYVIFNIFSYMTSSPISEYQVSQGTITTNNIYRGLVLRDEKVYIAPKAGHLNRYIKNNTKASVYDIVCSVDTDGSISRKLSKADKSGLNSGMSMQISSEISDFSNAYSMMDYKSAANFKSDLNSEVSQSLNAAALSELQSDVDSAVEKKTFYPIHPDVPGIVLYYVDGLEERRVDTFTPNDLSLQSSQKQNLDSLTEIKENHPMFKVIESDEWDVILKISDELAGSIGEKKSIKVKFTKDGYTTNTEFSLMKQNGSYYLDLHFKSAVIRYSMDRHLDVELILSANEGLKIPKSSIVKKDFFVIPKSCFFEKKNEQALLIKSKEKGKADKEVVPAIYYEDKENYYIDSEYVSERDLLVQNNSAELYTAGTKRDSLEGVYNINKGYAVFKRIKILFENEEYAIIDAKTKYGISLYDHIALDGSRISQNDFITMK